MESLINILESHRGKTIELVTNAGQKLSGIVDAAHEDFFTLTAITRIYFVPYTAVSTLIFPPDRPRKEVRQETPSYSEPGAKRLRRKTSQRKQSTPPPVK
jgi:hypothetical protein